MNDKQQIEITPKGIALMELVYAFARARGVPDVEVRSAATDRARKFWSDAEREILNGAGGIPDAVA